MRRIARARRRRELNEALDEFHGLVEPVLRPFLRRRLQQLRVGGPDGTWEEPEDILNLLLQRVAKTAKSFRRATDEEARAWLRRQADWLVTDAGKTPLRRWYIFVRGQLAEILPWVRSAADEGE